MTSPNQNLLFFIFLMLKTAIKPQVTKKVKQTILPHYVELGYIRDNGEFVGKNQVWYVIPLKGIAVHQGEGDYLYKSNQIGEKVEYFHDADKNSSLVSYLYDMGVDGVFGGSLISEPNHLQMFTPLKEGDIVEELCEHNPMSSKIDGVQQDTICAHCRIVLEKAEN